MLVSSTASTGVIGGQTMLYALGPISYTELGRSIGVGFAVAGAMTMYLTFVKSEKQKK